MRSVLNTTSRWQSLVRASKEIVFFKSTFYQKLKVNPKLLERIFSVVRVNASRVHYAAALTSI
jgi:hypothetical protein